MIDMWCANSHQQSYGYYITISPMVSPTKSPATVAWSLLNQATAEFSAVRSWLPNHRERVPILDIQPLHRGDPSE